MDANLLARLWSQIDTSGGVEACWPWRGYFVRDRGQIAVSGGLQYTHRVVWTLANGPVPSGLVIRHICDNPPCCNPMHLLSGTQAENVADMFRRHRGNRAFGERVATAKLTHAIVNEIRRSYTGRRGEQVALANRYGVSRTAINKAIHGGTWTREK